MDHTVLQTNPAELKDKSDNEVLDGLKLAIKEERRATLQVLFYLREAERRMIYAKHGYPSLYEFVVKFLGYSEGGAYRRIAAMRLMRELPEVQRKIEQGALSFSGLAQVQSFFISERREKSIHYSSDQKLALLESVQNKSTREIEKSLLQISPEQIPKERIRQLTEDLSEMKIIVDEKLRSKLDHLRDLLSHLQPSMPYGMVIHKASDIAIEKLDPQLKQTSRKSPPALKRQCVTSDFNTLEMQKENIETKDGRASSTQPKSLAEHTKITTSLRRAIWSRDKGRCVFTAEETGKICGARHLLEIDHIIPVGKGGLTELTNLRLVCRAHNLLSATQEYGDAHMQKYVSWLGDSTEEKLTQKRD